MLTDDTKGIQRRTFDSMAELQRFIDSTPRTWPDNSSETERAQNSWDLNAGWKGAQDMAQNGWLEGAARVGHALKAFVPATPAPATRTDFYGHMPHVPRYCAGAPDSMIRYADSAVSGARPVLSLYVALNASCMTKAQYMANFGIAVAGAINTLEANGTRVELYGAMGGKMSMRGGKEAVSTWCIKRASQPLDLAVLAYSIGHPAVFRRLGFALLERSSAPYQENYGIPLTIAPRHLLNPPPGAVILNGMKDANKVAATPEQALEYVTKQIAEGII